MGDKSDFDDDGANENAGLSCALEMFSESKEVIEMINNIPSLHSPDSIQTSEKALERFRYIVNQYKEQPHLLDPYLDEILSNIVTIVRRDEFTLETKHMAFKYLFIVTNVRSYKVVVRHLPHEVSDLEPTLRLLEKQDSKDTTTWETRYCLLLWLSIIVMIPFHMSRLDSGAESKTVVERFIEESKKYLMAGDSCRNVAAFLSARFLTRSDIKDVHLATFFNWIMEAIPQDTSWGRFGPLASLAAILKHGKREDLLPHAPRLLECILAANCQQDEYPLSSKYAMKIVARIGLTFLKPRVAKWRYSRGSRSLVSNLSKPAVTNQGEGDIDDSNKIQEDDDDEDEEIPTEIEDVIEELIQGMKNENSIITRWAAAKGIGRVMARLSKQSGDEVVCSILELLDPTLPEGAWHGGCLALAELARRGLLLPARLPEVVPLVTKALAYDEPRGYTSVGKNVRDAACYVCWAFARAYHPDVIAPYCQDIAKTLLIVSCFDREITCRRAASAAFQECVGRLGNFPYGIDILTTADYFSVGLRNNAYLKISVFIAQYEAYTEGLIEHLLQRKVDHWDPAIRTLTAKALFNLTPCSPNYLATEGLQSLVAQTKSIDLNARHGSILALGEVLHALSLIENIQIDPSYLSEAEMLVSRLKERQQLRGMSGELMKIACCSFVDNCSRAKLPFHGKPVIAEWQELVDECLTHESVDTRQAAASAFAQLSSQFYADDSQLSTQMRTDVVTKYTSLLRTNNQTSRMGYALALGSLPAFMLKGHLCSVIRNLVQCSKITSDSVKWAESRSAALKALASICLNVRLGKDDTEASCYGLVVEVLEALLEGFKDYTNDSRGDVGAWVREAAMLGIKDVVMLTVDEASEVLAPELITRTFVEVSQQSVERIDRTRGYAGRVFSSLLHKDGKPVPHIPSEMKLREIFSEELCRKCNWIASADTFPLFVQLLALPEFTKSVLLGLVGSVGGLSETLVKYSSQALYNYLQQQSAGELSRLCDVLASLFEQYQHDDRITIPMFSFLERLLTSNCVSVVIYEPQNNFSNRILRCGKTEIAKSVNSKKLTASVNFFCQLIQVPGEVCRRSLVQLGIFLCHRFLWLRRETATKLYEALLVYSDECGVNPEKLEPALAILSDTDWSVISTESARSERNRLCELLGIPTPKSGAGPAK